MLIFLQLVALSEFHIRQIINKSYCAEDSYAAITDDVISDMVGQIYKTKVNNHIIIFFKS